MCVLASVALTYLDGARRRALALRHLQVPVSVTTTSVTSSSGSNADSEAVSDGVVTTTFDPAANSDALQFTNAVALALDALPVAATESPMPPATTTTGRSTGAGNLVILVALPVVVVVALVVGAVALRLVQVARRRRSGNFKFSFGRKPTAIPTDGSNFNLDGVVSAHRAQLVATTLAVYNKHPGPQAGSHGERLGGSLSSPGPRATVTGPASGSVIATAVTPGTGTSSHGVRGSSPAPTLPDPEPAVALRLPVPVAVSLSLALDASESTPDSA
jgi:hypothetical protein